MRTRFLMHYMTLILVAVMPIALLAQTATVTGRVIDASTGGPLPGADVILVGTPLGSAADVNGEYRILGVPPGTYQVRASYIGFTGLSQSIDVVGEAVAELNFELAIDVLELESVVVTGMGGTQVKGKLGISVASVDPEEIDRSDEVNVVQALAGKAAGVEIRETSGDPGTNSYIRIRGGSSIDQSTQPLFVVDGVPISNRSDYTVGFNGGTETSNRAADINTEDIAAVEILKGAAASAIYGSRASNGVVLITTKSGRPGKVKISFKSVYGTTEQSKFYPLQTSFGQGTKGKYRKNYSRSWGRPLTAEDKVYDHGREITNGGYNTEQNVTISGGNNFTTFFLSFGRSFEEGHWVEGSDYERLTARLKGTQRIGDKLRLTGNLAYANTSAHYLQRGDNAIGLQLGNLRSPPEWNNKPYIDPATGFHRSYRYSDAKVLRKTRKFDNPFFIMKEHSNPRDVRRMYGYLKAEYDLFDWVGLSYTLGNDYSNDDGMYVNPLSGSREGGVGVIRRVDFIYQESDGNFIATIQGRRFFKDPNIINGTLMVGHNWNSRNYSRLRATGIDMGVPDFDQLDNTVSTNLSTNEYEWVIHTESFFGQATLDLFDQLYLTGSVRNDGSSTFGASQKRHTYPKFSTAWEFTKTVPGLPLLDFGKLRFAWGQAGVEPSVYSTISGFSSGSKGFSLFTSQSLNVTHKGKSGSFLSSNKGTENIKPERTTETEFGLNLAFWDSRIGIDLTGYQAISTDVIFDLNLVPSTGFFSQTDNGATIENKGIEAMLDIAAIRSKMLSWNIGLIYASNKSMVTKMRDRNNVPVWEQIGRWAFAGEGHELGELRLNTFKRFGYGHTAKEGGETVNLDEKYSGWTKGDIYIPEDGYPVMNPERIWSGLSANPKWTGSVRNQVTLFGNLTLSAFFDIVQGHYIMNHGAGALFSYGTHKGTENRGQVMQIPLVGTNEVNGVGPNGRTDVKGWGPGAGKEVELTEKWYRSAGAGFSGDGFQFTEDASYVKLREVSATYTLKNDFIKNMGLGNVSVRVSLRNWKTWTDYSGFDPETNRRQATNARDSDYFNQPQVRALNFTLRVNL